MSDLNPFDPNETGPAISPLQEAVLSLLEDAGISTDTCDKIMALIEEAENDAASNAEQAYRDRIPDR